MAYLISEATQRVKRLAAEAFNVPMQDGKHHYGMQDRQIIDYVEGWRINDFRYSSALRHAYAQAYVLERMQPVISEDELIVGAPDLRPLSKEEQHAYEQALQLSRMLPTENGRRGHMTLDFEKLLRVGVNGLISEIEEKRALLNLESPDDLPKDEFYEGALAELHALLNLAKRYREEALRLAKESEFARQKELEEIADILSRIPAQPAKTFREGLQSIHFYAFCLWDLYFYGRLDQYLFPLYKADLAKGQITPEEAQELIDCFELQVPKYTHSMRPMSTGAQVITIAGRDSNGNLVNNDLTRMFLISVTHFRLTTIQMQLLIGKDSDPELLETALLINSMGITQPQIYNDDLITQEMIRVGYPKETAHHWAGCGCVEIVPCGCSAIWPVSPYHNTLQALLDAMRSSPATLEDLINLFAERIRKLVIEGNISENRWQMERSRNRWESTRVSCLVNDCIALGKSHEDGGGRYNFIQPCFLGMSNVIDSLAAVDELVYTKHEYTMEELMKILDNDFIGHEDLRLRMVHKMRHFGTNEPYTDALAKRIGDILIESVQNVHTWRGSTLQPGAFSYQEHVRHGGQTQASPDGRHAGYPLCAGSSPVQGREIEGPTASLISSAAWNQAAFLGGVSNNLSFSKKNMTPEGRKAIATMIGTFFEMGGFEVQLNITDRETLLKAREEPEKYRDLLVRVGGFNAYFIGCDPRLQQEIIDRTEHSL